MQDNFKILVAGGDGFLGQHVVKKLKEKNMNVASHSMSDGYDFRDFEKVKELLEREKFDVVINCAAYVGGIQFIGQHHGEIFYNNILILAHVMEAARLTGVKKYINPIPNCVYPGDLTFFSEKDLWSGAMHESILSYAFTKKAGLVQGWSYKKQYDFDSTHLIFPNLYGPADHFDEVRSHALGALVRKFVDAKKEDKPEVIVWGSGKPIREWLYVEDAAEAIVRSLHLPFMIDPVNIGVGKGISIGELAEVIKKEVGYQGKIVFDTSKPDGALMKTMNNKKMKEVFDWEPQTDFKDGLKKTIEWYLTNVKNKN